MNKPINRYVGVPQLLTPAISTGTGLTLHGRRCHRCQRSKFTAGGRVRWVFRNNRRVSIFTCAGCVA